MSKSVRALIAALLFAVYAAPNQVDAGNFTIKVYKANGTMTWNGTNLTLEFFDADDRPITINVTSTMTGEFTNVSAIPPSGASTKRVYFKVSRSGASVTVDNLNGGNTTHVIHVILP